MVLNHSVLIMTHTKEPFWQGHCRILLVLLITYSWSVVVCFSVLMFVWLFGVVCSNVCSFGSLIQLDLNRIILDGRSGEPSTSPMCGAVSCARPYPQTQEAKWEDPAYVDVILGKETDVGALL